MFGKKTWERIREGLLGKQKYVAIVNNYADDEDTCNTFEVDGAINVRRIFELEKDYIREEAKQSKRNNALNEIFRMEKQMDKNVQSQENEHEKEEFSAKKFSLESSLNSAELDSRRLIDTQNALSTEILHEFVPATKIKGREDFIPESSHYKLYDDSSKFTVNVEREFDLHFPQKLNVYCYMSEEDFKPSLKGKTGVLNYYLMDGASVLPILALDLKPGLSILDMCAAPGGKSLLCLQSLYPDKVVSNDVSRSRVNRIENVYRQFLYDFNEIWLKTGKIKLTNHDGRFITNENFDRILVSIVFIISFLNN